MPVSGYKILGQANPAANTVTALYTVPAGTSTMVSTINICNTGGATGTFNVSVAAAGEAAANKQFLFFGKTLEAASTLTLTTGITLAATDVLRVSANSANFSFNAFGHTEYEALSINELQNIVAKLTTIDSSLTKIEGYQNIVKNLAVGDGIHVTSPYEWLTYSTIYNLLIEKGTVLDSTDEVSAASQAKAITELKTYISKLQGLDKWLPGG